MPPRPQGPQPAQLCLLSCQALASEFLGTGRGAQGQVGTGVRTEQWDILKLVDRGQSQVSKAKEGEDTRGGSGRQVDTGRPPEAGTSALSPQFTQGKLSRSHPLPIWLEASRDRGRTCEARCERQCVGPGRG